MYVGVDIGNLFAARENVFSLLRALYMPSETSEKSFQHPLDQHTKMAGEGPSNMS